MTNRPFATIGLTAHNCEVHMPTTAPRVSPDHPFTARRHPAFVIVPPTRCLMVDGVDDPKTSAAWQDALAAMYGLSYSLKFAIQKWRTIIRQPVREAS